MHPHNTENDTSNNPNRHHILNFTQSQPFVDPYTRPTQPGLREHFTPYQDTSACITHYPEQWLLPNAEYQCHHPPHVPSTSLSSPSHTRFSNHSDFSGQSWRFSAASTNTSWSGFSDTASFHPLVPSLQQVDGNSASHGHQVTDLSSRSAFRSDQQPAHGRKASQDKEHYLTCVSRVERSSNSAKEPRYWCTSCGKGFKEKYDWKRHEETYQERFEDFQCDLCKKAYFLDKDFAHHHQRRHNCQTCAEKDHIGAARRKRTTRTGWGCGFCLHYETDWLERCRHIARHFKNGKRMGEWIQTQVILSLLEQPLVRGEWNRLLASKQECYPAFDWQPEWTGRAEGYPDIGCPPQLQDLLEFFTPGQDAAALARLTYELGHRQDVTHLSQHTAYVPGAEPQPLFSTGGAIRGSLHSTQDRAQEFSQTMDMSIQKTPPSLTDKALPSLPVKSSAAKHRPHFHNAATAHNVQISTTDFVPWGRFADNIIPDHLLPDIAEIDFDSLDHHFEPGQHNF